ncbi:MAG: FeoB-associated Cys-rich membrane protein [Acutalibacteraceae bacterium]|nr:FeoB-associated Cys-rich membrane protein [Acutalibacteraceae bacterium]
MENYIIIGIVVGAVGGAIRYILKAKKRGDKCIGCPHAKQCGTTKKDKECSCNSK